ncbi:hypothetical protein BKA70DRAFT_1334356, partial [Coprinopsis sp. MPI-PUGE-AT-0042]
MLGLVKKRDETKRMTSGVLIDWDRPTRVDAQGNGLEPRSGHRIGSLPFMSPELLHPLIFSRDPPPHRYEHDLESFIYILLSAAVRYNTLT